MVPQLGPEHLLTLEQQKRAIQNYNLMQAQEMLLKLCQLSVQQDLIIRGATRRIAELECTLALLDLQAEPEALPKHHRA